jgi:hypothetical protein
MKKAAKRSVSKPAKKAVKKTRTDASTDAAPLDRRVERLLGALSQDRALASSVREFEKGRVAGGRRKFGSNGLKADGKLFALFTQDTLVVKLANNRVSALVEAGVGTPFDPGHGRLMKGWLTVTSPRASWVDLAREAHAFVSGRS